LIPGAGVVVGIEEELVCVDYGKARHEMVGLAKPSGSDLNARLETGGATYLDPRFFEAG
jgi:hypothetical protein